MRLHWLPNASVILGSQAKLIAPEGGLGREGTEAARSRASPRPGCARTIETARRLSIKALT